MYNLSFDKFNVRLLIYIFCILIILCINIQKQHNETSKESFMDNKYLKSDIAKQMFPRLFCFVSHQLPVLPKNWQVDIFPKKFQRTILVKFT